MTTDLPASGPTEPGGASRDTSTLPLVFGTLAVLCLAVVLTIAALVAADDDETTDTGGGAAAVPVALTEFAVNPESVMVGSGGSLEVVNEGEVVHNLAVADTDLVTPDLSSGESAELDLSSLAEGSYEILCLIPGHADSGMRGTLEVMAEGATPMDHGGGEIDWAQRTEDMLATFAAYPAETEGKGNQPLEPTEVKDDGTKVFDLTMMEADWEVEPGKVVRASTFNGTVPGPLIELEVGDKVEMRVQNDLPMATDLHLHGMNVTNANDGVSPLTQDLIEPGDSFTYTFTADEPATAMYHPHAHGFHLLPNGLFGVLLVGDTRLPLGQTVGFESIPPSIEIAQEIPMVLNDSGVIGLSLNGKSFPATAPYTAEVGDWVLIQYYNEGNQIHPMHLHQFDQIVVAKDGYPLDAPYTADTVNVAPGERYSVLVQLDKAGAWAWHCHILTHAERDSGMFGMVTAFIVE